MDSGSAKDQQVSQKREKLWLTSSVTSSLGISRNKTRTLIEIVVHLQSYEGNGTMLTSVRDRRIVCTTQSKDGRHVAVVDWATATSNNLAVVPAINKAFSNMVDRVDRPKRPGREAKAVPNANGWCLLGTKYSICRGFGVNVQPTQCDCSPLCPISIFTAQASVWSHSIGDIQILLETSSNAPAWFL
jgi:hypothetical protein